MKKTLFAITCGVLMAGCQGTTTTTTTQTPEAKAEKPATPAAKPATRALAGKYVLDKNAMVKVQEAEIAKLPKEQQGMAKALMEIVKQMDASIEFKDGGVAEFTATTPPMKKGDKPEKKTELGKWSEKAGEIVIINDKDKKEMKCKAAAGKLTCNDGKMEMVFNKS